ncbi:hypothetical protein D3C87_952510 [compost metagenome]
MSRIELIRTIRNCELGEESDVLRELAEAKDWPIIVINEQPNPHYYHDPDDIPDFHGEYIFDTKKLVEDPNGWRDMGCVRYVASIIESALNGNNSTTASRKYSFGDTPDWWVPFGPEEEETYGRAILHIEVDINY